MPVEAKPIFRPDVIRLPILGFSLPESVLQRRPKLENWARIIAGGSVDAHKEVEILGDFLNDVFCELLGYTRAVDNHKRYTISREKHVQANGKFADAVLGEVARGEAICGGRGGKGPKDPLDRPFAGRKVSAVDQAFDYAINLRCNWILVTNIRQTRLYYKGTDKQTYERLTPRPWPPTSGSSRSSSSCSMRTGWSRRTGRATSTPAPGLGEGRPRDHPGGVCGVRLHPQEHALPAAVGEPRGRSPADPGLRGEAARPHPVHRLLRGPGPAAGRDDQAGVRAPRPVQPPAALGEFPRDVPGDQRRQRALDIRKYNGGLFADDPVLDGLKVPDEVFGMFDSLAEYDFRPASAIPAEEVVSDKRLVDVEILGHIFEQSIDDLEKLQAELEKPVEIPSKLEARAEQGEGQPAQAPGGLLHARLHHPIHRRAGKSAACCTTSTRAIRRDHAGKAKGTARDVLADPRAYDLDALKSPQRQALLAFWEGLGGGAGLRSASSTRPAAAGRS